LQPFIDPTGFGIADGSAIEPVMARVNTFVLIRQPVEEFIAGSTQVIFVGFGD
jgi:hypothetical protein